MNTLELLQAFPGISEDSRKLLSKAICTRGKHKGYLLSNAPSEASNPDGWLAWQVLVSHLAVSRVATWSLMFSNKSEQWKELEEETRPMLSALNCVEPAYRWNLWANRYDREATMKVLEKAIAKANQSSEVDNHEH